MKEVLCW